ncbi:MAG: E3 ubiquitin protein ligase [Candidatus Heimdallarchaeota archaeon]|nr:E3 ubiquitin protein ligase [Candidatus Heimdallarchaeota archaeon]
MVEWGLLLFLVFISISLIVAARAAIKGKKKQKAPKRRYKPYQPPAQTRTSSPVSQTHQPRSSSPTPYAPTQSESRAAYASADEYFRSGMFDRAKEEYLKTGRIFGASKSVAAKGREFVSDALQIISRYAPEREEEMVRNLSRYFFDSGETEISAMILFEKNLTDEADAVLATIGKSISDIAPSGTVEVTPIEVNATIDEMLETQKSLEELEVIASEVIEEVELEPASEPERVFKGSQLLKVATTNLDERCSVCMSVIKAGESFVRCPFCETPSHYSHIVEWIKVKPQCPNCRKKLVARTFQQY